jgi:metal-responsive CopG/Arc/MetJ family transcriptional regulator
LEVYAASRVLDESLLRKCDRLAGEASRSEVFEQALSRWVRDRHQRSLEADIERYYSSLSTSEQTEDSEWAGLAPRLLGEIWK